MISIVGAAVPSISSNEGAPTASRSPAEGAGVPAVSPSKGAVVPAVPAEGAAPTGARDSAADDVGITAGAGVLETGAPVAAAARGEAVIIAGTGVRGVAAPVGGIVNPRDPAVGADVGAIMTGAGVTTRGDVGAPVTAFVIEGAGVVEFAPAVGQKRSTRKDPLFSTP